MPDDGATVRPARLDPAVELVERRQGARLEDLLLELAVVADDAVERLEREVAATKDVEHTDALHVMEEPPARALVVDVVEEALPRVPEGRMADVVTEGDGLDEVEVEPERATDVPSHPRHELHVQATTSEVVVCPKREDLGLAVEPVVGGHA